MRHLRIASTLTAAVAAAGFLAAGPATAAVTTASASGLATAGYTGVSGAGASWPSLMISQWAQDERARGLVVNFNPDGDAAGRDGFIQDQFDFAASSPPFRSGNDKLGDTGREVVPWTYSYIPVTAGGTAFLYHLTVSGHAYTSLHLTGRTLMEIFTGQITNWDNPQITQETGQKLPNLAITVVTHSEGSGDSWFLSRYLATEYTKQWNAFCERVHPGLKLPCGPTESYPPFSGTVAEDGDSNVAALVSYRNGAIGYAAYGYALATQLPVVAMGNAAGKYVKPTPANVTTALTRALINDDPKSQNYLQQDLTPVYTNPAPTSYPLSGYSYLIVPRTGKPPAIFSQAAGRTLSTYLNYALCAGQKQSSLLGYAPLPTPLVKGALQQVQHIPGHIASSSCS